MQMGSPSQDSVDSSTYSQKFRIDQVVSDGMTGKSISLTVPTLALMPLQPLGIKSATYDLELVVRELQHHTQLQQSEIARRRGKTAAAQAGHAAGTLQPEEGDATGMPAHEPRPWYLVAEPISVRGTLSDPGGAGTGNQRLASIKVHVEIDRTPTPAGLAKLLTAMTQMSSLSENSTPPVPPPVGNTPPGPPNH